MTGVLARDSSLRGSVQSDTSAPLPAGGNSALFNIPLGTFTVKWQRLGDAALTCQVPAGGSHLPWRLKPRLKNEEIMAEVPIDIDHVAQLARIALTKEEAARFSSQFTRLFEFIAELQTLDVSHIPATAQAIPLVNVLRDDAVTPCLSREAALENAPAKEGPYFKTPRILE